jgi:hypothetical protein
MIGSIFVASEESVYRITGTLLSVLGCALVILCADDRTLAGRFLGLQPFVAIGLISYSAYLWHQPLFALARVYLVDAPGFWLMSALCLVTFFLSYFSSRFIERPFRQREKMPRGVVIGSTLAGSVLMLILGAWFHFQKGLPERYSMELLNQWQDVDSRTYNERAYMYRRDAFEAKVKLKLLIVGNSYARDFVNVIVETYLSDGFELIYRDDLAECIDVSQPGLFKEADVIVFASGFPDPDCVSRDVSEAETNGKRLFYVGSKYFGANMNWIIRLPMEKRANLWNPMLDETLLHEEELVKMIPPDNYLSLLAPIVRDNRVPVTDNKGFPLTLDRGHLTRFGAVFLGEKALVGSSLGLLLDSTHRPAHPGESGN